ncbi:uncharacterized protein [Diadema antillarum]|uniref:uncharacterized protein n=1 Tax=Diadema antillarum TaxID=105358 RepID=UPI003A862D45
MGGLKNGKWTAPLPFKERRDRLPNNRSQALKRAQIFQTNMVRDPIKREHMLTFMEGVISKGHAEVAPPLDAREECWYLYHPKKKDKIRGVFDSLAKFMGHSLNKVLLKGPDLTNDLVGVLLRFRKGPVAVCGDIESMFFCFSVAEQHRNFLRFFWHEDNNFDKPLIEYRMLKHVFGNSPSPAVANYGLKDLARDAEPDVRDFIHDNFYVDDGLTSCEDAETAVSLMTRTRAMLQEKAGIHLHKIASNSQTVLDAFDPEEVQKDIRNLTLSDCIPTQRSLGVQWNLTDDTFRFQIELTTKPYTKRVLFMINGVFDPLGFLDPVMIQAKVLFREMITHKVEWDVVLPEVYRPICESWTSGLSELESLSIPRNYLTCPEKGTLHVYCDASEVAVVAVAYMMDGDAENPSASFVFGKSKLAPKSGHTIPRLELCAAVLATEVANVVCRELNIQAATVVFFTDSRIVLGYLNNTTRRFHTYVANRVHKVLSFSQPSQWRYVPTANNPADCGNRPVSARSLKGSSWLTGPQKIATQEVVNPVSEFPLVDPDIDEEIKQDVNIQVTKTSVELRGLVPRLLRTMGSGHQENQRRCCQKQEVGNDISCLTSRALHIEVLEELSTSSCINALRRFMAVRGKVETFWSDRGSNFVGVLNDKVFRTFIERNNTEWKLNPPHAPHTGGAWESMVGLFKRILNGILLEAKEKSFTHETLVTFMMEAMAIVNARPLVPLSSDPEDTSFLSPSVLLTQKHGSIEEVLVEDCKRNMYTAQWKRVQILADRFWKLWRLRYLQSLQQRRKWTSTERNAMKGDIVLLRDREVKRNQ